MLKKQRYEVPITDTFGVSFEDSILTASEGVNWGEPGYPGGDDEIIDIPGTF